MNGNITLCHLRLVLLIGMVIGTIVGCSHKPVGVTLQGLEELVLGAASESDVRQAFGEPAQTASPSGMTEHFWIYRNSKTMAQKAVVGFTREGLLSSKEWEVSDGDPEQKLEVALARFKYASFEKQEAPWENPHSGPDEIYYTDRNRGVFVVFRKARQEVSSITWSDTKLRDVAQQAPKQYGKCKDEIGLVSLCEAGH